MENNNILNSNTNNNNNKSHSNHTKFHKKKEANGQQSKKENNNSHRNKRQENNNQENNNNHKNKRQESNNQENIKNNPNANANSRQNPLPKKKSNINRKASSSQFKKDVKKGHTLSRLPPSTENFEKIATTVCLSTLPENIHGHIIDNGIDKYVNLLKLSLNENEKVKFIGVEPALALATSIVLILEEQNYIKKPIIETTTMEDKNKNLKSCIVTELFF